MHIMHEGISTRATHQGKRCKAINRLHRKWNQIRTARKRINLLIVLAPEFSAGPSATKNALRVLPEAHQHTVCGHKNNRPGYRIRPSISCLLSTTTAQVELREAASRPTLTRALHKSGRRLYVEMTFAIVKGDAEREVSGSVVRRFCATVDCIGPVDLDQRMSA